MRPILLRLGPVEIPTYGVLVAAAWLAGAQWLVRRRSEMGLSEDDVWSLVYWAFGGGLLGGKLLYFAVSPEAMTWSLDALRYGFVFYGGFLGALLAGGLHCRRRGHSFWRLADYAAPALALGHGIGRLGCLAAGCCYGRPTSLPWGIALEGDPSRHPTQAYEALLNFALFGLLVGAALPRVRDGRWRPGSVMVLYALGYAALRFGVEFLRGDDRGASWGGLSPSQWLALAIAAGAAAIWARRGRS